MQYLVQMKIVAQGNPARFDFAAKVRLLLESNPVGGHIQPLEPDLPRLGQ